MIQQKNQNRNSFNPLKIGSVFLISQRTGSEAPHFRGFNPLKIGSVFLIWVKVGASKARLYAFQSPKNRVCISDGLAHHLIRARRKSFNPLKIGSVFLILVKASGAKSLPSVSIP